MSKDTVRMALHNLADYPAGRTDDADEVIRLRGELAAALAKLDAANERARGMAIDLRRYALMNDRQARIISELNHTNDELRYQMRLAAGAGGNGLLTLTDRGDGADGYGVMPNE